MKKHFTIIAIALLLCLGLQSKERTQEQKRQLALSALKASTQTRAATADNIKELRTMDALTVMGYTDGGGFAIISNDDRHEAVLGWSDGRFNADKLPDGLEWWLNTANAVLESGNAYVRTITPATVGNGSLPESVDNFIAAKWGQGEPYNLQCPAVVTTRTLTGCVATAAAQIMYYYGYPTSGTGTEFDNMTLDKIDFANTNYDYGNMLPDYSPGYTDEQANAVATLMHHCGVATQMSYGTDASGAYSHVAAGAWRDHFKYSTEFYMREAYPQREWMNIIYEELGNHRPIQYGGVDENMGGHSFVFSGYNAEGLVYVNWGWEGTADGYYDVALLDPQNYRFASHQDMILMHTPDAPELTYKSQWGIMSGRGIDGDFTVSVSGNTLTYIATYLLQVDSDPFTGQIALMCEPVSGGAATAIDANDITDDDGSLMEVEYTVGFSRYGNDVDISGLANGTYRVYLASKATTEAAWQPVHYNENINGCYILTVDNGTNTVTTGIGYVTIPSTTTERDNHIYTIDGRYVGTDINNVGKGIYIYKGKKAFFKR